MKGEPIGLGGEVVGATLSPAELEQRVVGDYIDGLAARIVSPPTKGQIVEMTLVRHTPTDNHTVPDRPDHKLELRQLLGEDPRCEVITELAATSVRNDGSVITVKGGRLGDNFPYPSLTFTSSEGEGIKKTGCEAVGRIEEAIDAGDIQTIPGRRTIDVPNLEALTIAESLMNDELDEVISPS